MRYRNAVTGAEIDVPCRIGGENWEEIVSSQQTAGVSAPEKKAPATVEKPATVKKTAAKKPAAKKSTAKSTAGKVTRK